MSTCSVTEKPHHVRVRTKRRTIAIAILVAFIAALAYALLSEKQLPEPSYQGTSLSEWLEGPRGQAQLAVRSIGTSALPVLLDWVRYELPPWRQRLLKLATQPVKGKSLEEGKIVYGKSLIEGKRLRKAELADLGFSILYTNAAPAVPALEALMKNNQKPDLGLRAIHALSGIGAPAIPALTNALTDTNQINRPRIIQAIFVLERMAHDSHGVTHRSAWLPALTRALDDSDPEVRRQAGITLYNLEHHDEILARAQDGRAFREYMLRARTNALKTNLEALTNAPSK